MQQSTVWSDLVANCSASDFATATSKRSSSSTANQVRLVGKKLLRVDSKVRPVPRRLTAFFGRLYIATAEEEMVDFLSTAGIVEPRFKRLASKGKSFKTAAFMVSCNVSSRHLFYDEALCPSGCDLRDWIFYDRNEHSALKGASVPKINQFDHGAQQTPSHYLQHAWLQMWSLHAGRTL